MVNKFINQPTIKEVVTKINDVIDTIPAEQIQSDWNQTTTTAKDYIKNKPTIPTVPLEGVQINGTDLTITSKKVNIPLSGTDTLGVAKANAAYGVYNNSGTLTISKATDSQVTAKTSQYRPLVPYNIDLAVKAGITANSLTLTSAEKTAAQNWLGISGGSGVVISYDSTTQTLSIS